jgi:hypothetical protein
MLRAGFFTNAAGITGFLAKKELIGVFFTVLVNHQSLCRTINRTKATTRTFFSIDEQNPILLESKRLQEFSPAHPVFRS